VIPKEGLRKISTILANAATGGRETTKDVWMQTHAGTRGSSKLCAARGTSPNKPNESAFEGWTPKEKSPSASPNSLALKDGFGNGVPSSKGANERNTGPPNSEGIGIEEEERAFGASER